MGVRSLVPIEFLYITPYYCEFAASRQPCFCCSALTWSILSMISCRLCSVEVCFSSSSSTFNSPASCSQSVIELFLLCLLFLSYEVANRTLQDVCSSTLKSQDKYIMTH